MLGSIEQLFFSVDFISATIRLSIPLVFLSVGELFAERSGVVNIGLEGMMLFGAFAAVAGTFATGSPWAGVLFSIVAGAILAALLAYVAVSLAGDQIVTGIALNIAALGLTTFLSRTLWGIGKNPKVSAFKAINIKGWTDLPVVGEIFFHHTPLTYLAFLILPIASWILFRTRWGLRRQPGRVGPGGSIPYHHHFRYAGGNRGRLSVDQPAGFLRRRHDGRPGIHRTGDRHRSQVVSVPGGGRGPAVRRH